MTRFTRANDAHKRQPSEGSSWDQLKKIDSNPNFKKSSQSEDWKSERRLESKQNRQQKRRMKPCFNCRSFGHVVVNCPTLPKNDSTAAGICFKCGSAEHKSQTCKVTKNVAGVEFPFAACYVCGEKGHLSKTCPQNPLGAFPKGGSCHECGSVEHLRRECPKLFPNKVVQKKIVKTVGTLKSNESVEKLDSDDEAEIKPEPIPKKKKNRRGKNKAVQSEESDSNNQIIPEAKPTPKTEKLFGNKGKKKEVQSEKSDSNNEIKPETKPTPKTEKLFGNKGKKRVVGSIGKLDMSGAMGAGPKQKKMKKK